MRTVMRKEQLWAIVLAGGEGRPMKPFGEEESEARNGYE